MIYTIAVVIGRAKAETFKEACDLILEGDEWYDARMLTYKNSQLYDVEALRLEKATSE